MGDDKEDLGNFLHPSTSGYKERFFNHNYSLAVKTNKEKVYVKKKRNYWTVREKKGYIHQHMLSGEVEQ